MKKKFYLILLFCTMLITSSVLALNILASDKYEKYSKPIYKNKEISEMRHFTQDNDDKYISIFYLECKQEKLNEAIKTYISEETTYQSKQKYVHYTDYEKTKYFDDFISIKFHQFIYNNDEKIVEQIHIINYDVKADKVMQLDDVLRKDYKDMILTLLHKESKVYSIEDISDFYINKNEIDVYFNHEEKDVISIPYQEFQSYIKLKCKEIPSLYQNDIVQTSVENIDPTKPMVAFTFDDGPSEAYTQKIMDAFDKVNGKATFFMLGSQASKYEEIVKEVDRRAFEIANHTTNHKNLKTLSDEDAYKEIMDTQDLLYAYTGKDANLLRPPYGSFPNIDVKAMNLALWNVDTLDWKSRNVQAIKTNILNNIADGSIILMHDIYETSAISIQEILPTLKAQGYQFVTMSTLIKYRYS